MEILQGWYEAVLAWGYLPHVLAFGTVFFAGIKFGETILKNFLLARKVQTYLNRKLTILRIAIQNGIAMRWQNAQLSKPILDGLLPDMIGTNPYQVLPNEDDAIHNPTNVERPKDLEWVHQGHSVSFTYAGTRYEKVFVYKENFGTYVASFARPEDGHALEFRFERIK